MSNLLHEASDDLFLSILASSDGDASLAAERYDTIVGNEYGTTKEYAVEAKIAGLNIETADMLSSKFRTLLIVKLYKLISDISIKLAFSLDELKPAELARTHASLVNTFSTLTAPATKVTFDYEGELQRLAEEFQMPIEEVRGDFKKLETKLKAVK